MVERDSGFRTTGVEVSQLGPSWKASSTSSHAANQAYQLSKLKRMRIRGRSLLEKVVRREDCKGGGELGSNKRTGGIIRSN